jgi:hypothetical protein
VVSAWRRHQSGNSRTMMVEVVWLAHGSSSSVNECHDGDFEGSQFVSRSDFAVVCYLEMLELELWSELKVATTDPGFSVVLARGTLRSMLKVKIF